MAFGSHPQIDTALQSDLDSLNGCSQAPLKESSYHTFLQNTHKIAKNEAAQRLAISRVRLDGTSILERERLDNATGW